MKLFTALLLTKSFAKTKCLWLMGILINIVEGSDDHAITCFDSLHTPFLLSVSSLHLRYFKQLLDHFKRLCSLWRVVEGLTESCQDHMHMLNYCKQPGHKPTVVSGNGSAQIKHVALTS